MSRFLRGLTPKHPREGTPMTFTRDGELAGVREYSDGYVIHLVEHVIDEEHIGDEPMGEKRFVLEALNEGGFNSTLVDVMDVLLWLREYRPDLLKPVTDPAAAEAVLSEVKESNAELDVLVERIEADVRARMWIFVEALHEVGVSVDLISRASTLFAETIINRFLEAPAEATTTVPDGKE